MFPLYQRAVPQLWDILSAASKNIASVLLQKAFVQMRLRNVVSDLITALGAIFLI